MNSTRIRVRFTKLGDLRWCSHRDLQRAWERLLRRADLQLVFTEGFHARPKINFPSALALGMESVEEFVEIELHEAPVVHVIQQRLNEQTLDGMEILEVRLLGAGDPKAKLLSSQFEVEVPSSRKEQIEKNLEERKQAGEIPFVRDGKQLATKLDANSMEVEFYGNQLRITLYASDSATIKPTEILEAIGLAGIQQEGAELRRTRVVLAERSSANDVFEDVLESTSAIEN